MLVGFIPKIYPPTDQLSDVTLFPSFTSGVARTGLVASTSIQTELESHVVNLVDNRLDAVGPFCWVGDKFSGAVAAFGGPAVVNVDVYSQHSVCGLKKIKKNKVLELS